MSRGPGDPGDLMGCTQRFLNHKANTQTTDPFPPMRGGLESDYLVPNTTC